MGGPTAPILSRQNLPVLENLSAQEKRQGTLKGGYTLVKETTKLENIIIGVGSELSMAVEAAKELGPGTRVVSMPCVELYEAQSAEYKEEVLPKAMKAQTTAVEAGVTSAWYKFADKVLGVDTFGLSAPGDQVYEKRRGPRRKSRQRLPRQRVLQRRSKLRKWWPRPRRMLMRRTPRQLLPRRRRLLRRKPRRRLLRAKRRRRRSQRRRRRKRRRRRRRPRPRRRRRKQH